MSLTLTVLQFACAIHFGILFLMWLLSVRLRDASIIDSYWSLGFLVFAGTGYYCSLTVNDAEVITGELRRFLLLLIVTLWAIRLAAYLTVRNWSEPEDKRYADMRLHHGSRFWWVSLFTVFILQGVIAVVVGAPVVVGMSQPGSNEILVTDVLGLGLFFVGLYFESVGDAQLAAFKADPGNAGRVMKYGLWRYSRHPNYFGDACVWWGIFLLVCRVEYGYLTVFGPMIMTLFLLKVSGVTMLESYLSREKGSEYEVYKQSTSAFFPRPPRGID